MIYLHIGRGKAGSTTIQTFLSANKVHLSNERYQVVDRLRFMSAVAALNDTSSGSANALEEFRQVFDANPNTSFIISHEYLFDVQDRKQVEAIRQITSAHDVKVIAYLRDHPSLLLSLYNQATKKGKNISDFDAYTSKISPTLSAVATVTAWADVFGWDKLRVRSLDPKSLNGGHLVDDYVAAIKLPLSQGFNRSVDRMNTSEPWVWLELRRAMFRQFHSYSNNARREHVPQVCRKLLRRLIEKCNQEQIKSEVKAQYLTPIQWGRLSDSYNNEISEINSHIEDHQIPKFLGVQPSSRPYLPSIGNYPRPFARRLSSIMKNLTTRNSEEQRLLADLCQELPKPGRPSRVTNGLLVEI